MYTIIKEKHKYYKPRNNWVAICIANYDTVLLIWSTPVFNVSCCSQGVTFDIHGISSLLLRPLAYKCVL